MSLQIAINIQLPKRLGGLEAQSLLVCTQKPSKRLIQMIESLQNSSAKYQGHDFKFEDGIHLTYTNRLNTLLQILKFGMMHLLEKNNIKLIVVVNFRRF